MRSKSIISIIFILLILTSSVSAADLGTLSYWYANYNVTDSIGRWSFSPSIWSAPKDSTFTTSAFASYVNHATSQWNSAGISTYGIDSESDADIKIYGGSLATIRAIDPTFSSNSSGETRASAYQEGTWTYAGSTKKGYTILYATVLIQSISGKSASAYKNVFTHETGHALGWMGESSNTSDVMYHTQSTITTLTTRDKNHLVQVY